MSENVSRDLAKYWWLRCVACSEASLTTQMRGFGFKEQVHEQALHAFSGGFMHRGHVCGLMTGATLAAGFVAQERFTDDATKAGATLYAAIQLTNEFPEYSGFTNCREITKTDLTKLSGRFRYFREGKGRMCGRLHLKWAPWVYQIINNSMAKYKECKPTKSCANCAVQTTKQIKSKSGIEMGSPTLMAGFAGGVGLGGNVCASLAAGVYALSISHQLDRSQKKRDSRFRGSFEELIGTCYRGTITRLRFDFMGKFGSELCEDIIDLNFRGIEEYANFMESANCENVIKYVADWVGNPEQK